MDNNECVINMGELSLNDSYNEGQEPLELGNIEYLFKLEFFSTNTSTDESMSTMKFYASKIKKCTGFIEQHYNAKITDYTYGDLIDDFKIVDGRYIIRAGNIFKICEKFTSANNSYIYSGSTANVNVLVTAILDFTEDGKEKYTKIIDSIKETTNEGFNFPVDFMFDMTLEQFKTTNKIYPDGYYVLFNDDNLILLFEKITKDVKGWLWNSKDIVYNVIYPTN